MSRHPSNSVTDPKSGTLIVDSSTRSPLNPLAVTGSCDLCGKFTLYDRRVYETLGGRLRVVLKGRAHGDCPGGSIRHDAHDAG